MMKSDRPREDSSKKEYCRNVRPHYQHVPSQDYPSLVRSDNMIKCETRVQTISCIVLIKRKLRLFLFLNECKQVEATALLKTPFKRSW